MTTQDFRLNLDDKLTLTERELDLLRAHAASGDRVGFYMAYYNMTGNALFPRVLRSTALVHPARQTAMCDCLKVA